MSQTWPELICEGRCNPGIATLDGEVAAYMAQLHDANKAVSRIDPKTLFARQRALVYRPHIHIRRDRWKCAVCSTPRSW